MWAVLFFGFTVCAGHFLPLMEWPLVFIFHMRDSSVFICKQLGFCVVAVPILSNVSLASDIDGLTHDGKFIVDWTFNLTPQWTYGAYQNSPVRSSFQDTGVVFSARHQDRSGIAAGITHTDLRFKTSIPTLRQDAFYFSGHFKYMPEADVLPGSLTLRGDVHQVNNNDATNETNQVFAIGPQIAYLGHGKSEYFDLGYTHTRYGKSHLGNPSLNVRQWTPTAGFGFNQGEDWVQLRIYGIRFDSSARTRNLSGTHALEAKWMHYLKQGGRAPDQVQVSALLGKRMYAIDGDAAVVFNIPDLQKGSLSAMAQWQVTSGMRWLLSGGYSRYETLAGGASTVYSASSLYTGLNVQW